MNYNRNIDHIRQLLDRYYRAETTPEEEDHIIAFFQDTDASDIPEDMSADMKLFGSLNAFRPLPADTEAPDNLLEKLGDIVGNAPSATVTAKRIHRRRILKYSGIAAAACIIWAIILMIPKPVENAAPPHEHLTAEATLHEADDSLPLTIISSVQKETLEDPPSSAPAITTPEEVKNDEPDDDGFIEITDPEEARKIAISIGKLLAQNAETANDAIAQIGNSLDSYKEITKTILQ